MNRFLAVIVFGLLCASIGRAQNKSKPLLLEVQILGVGMASPQGKHLYLGVYCDGRVEYEDGRMKGAVLKYFVRRGKLNAAEFKALSSHLDGPVVRTLATEYPPLDPPIDYGISLTVSIPHRDQPQTITIGNYLPEPAKLIHQDLYNYSVRSSG